MSLRDFTLPLLPKPSLQGMAPSYPCAYEMRPGRNDQAEQLGQPCLESGTWRSTSTCVIKCGDLSLL